MSNYESTGCSACIALGATKAGGKPGGLKSKSKEDTSVRLARQLAAGWRPGAVAPSRLPLIIAGAIALAGVGFVFLRRKRHR